MRFSQKHFENWPFWKTAILIYLFLKEKKFFAWSPWKSVKMYVRDSILMFSLVSSKFLAMRNNSLYSVCMLKYATYDGCFFKLSMGKKVDVSVRPLTTWGMFCYISFVERILFVCCIAFLPIHCTNVFTKEPAWLGLCVESCSTYTVLRGHAHSLIIVTYRRVSWIQTFLDI